MKQTFASAMLALPHFRLRGIRENSRLLDIDEKAAFHISPPPTKTFSQSNSFAYGGTEPPERELEAGFANTTTGFKAAPYTPKSLSKKNKSPIRRFKRTNIR